MGTKRIAGLFAVLALTGCPIPESNPYLSSAVEGITIDVNRTPVTGTVTFLEGKSVILNANLSPAGTRAEVFWQSSRTGIVDLSDVQGGLITVSGVNGGETAIKALAKNFQNEEYIEGTVKIKVIPVSFFKWNYQKDGWIDIPANNNGTVNGMVVRASGQAVNGDPRGGLVLDGSGPAGACFIIGSAIQSATNSPFSDDPVYDKTGAINCWDGPSSDLTSWNKRVRISLDYEFLTVSGNQDTFFRIQINNNTISKDNASAINNWLVAELAVPTALTDKPAGTLTGIFDGAQSALSAKAAAVTGLTVNNVLSRSFAAISLSPESGKALIRNIRIESAD